MLNKYETLEHAPLRGGLGKNVTRHKRASLLALPPWKIESGQGDTLVCMVPLKMACQVLSSKGRL